MYDGGKILAGLGIFVVVLTLPTWYGALAGGPGEPPELELPQGEAACVESREYMRDWHMELLDSWRDDVVRNAGRFYVAEDGREHEMSLVKSCLGCHADKSAFCDRCHDYAGVSPGCWECHIEPGLAVGPASIDPLLRREQ